MSHERPAESVNERLLSLDVLDQPAASGWYCSWLARGALTAVGGITFLFVLAEFFPMRNGREVARAIECRNHLRRIGDALHSYRNRYGTFPPLSIRGEDGQPMHSWRTLILPEFTQETLPPGDTLEVAQQVNLTVPWDHPSNTSVAGQTPFRFHCPSSTATEGKTTYLAVANANGAMGLRVRGLDGDDAEVTILAVEVPADKAVPWMAPRDLGPDQLNQLFEGERRTHLRWFHVLLDDGVVVTASRRLRPVQVRVETPQPRELNEVPLYPADGATDPALSDVRTPDVDAATLPAPVAAAAN